MTKNCFTKLIRTDSRDYSSLVLRIALGVFMFAHGGQKMFGLWGGNGFEGTMGFFTGSMGIPYIIALLVILGESFGAIALIFGFMTRFMAGSIGVILLGAIFMVHLKEGFYGFELHFLGVAMAIALVIKGGGALSIDSLIKKYFKKS